MGLREQADAGLPVVLEDETDPAAQTLRQAARGLLAMLPVELPVLAGVSGDPTPQLEVVQVKPTAGPALPMA